MIGMFPAELLAVAIAVGRKLSPILAVAAALFFLMASVFDGHGGSSLAGIGATLVLTNISQAVWRAFGSRGSCP